MQWILIVMICNHLSAWSTVCETKAIATFLSRGACMEAAKQYSEYKPICGEKPQPAKAKE